MIFSIVLLQNFFGNHIEIQKPILNLLKYMRDQIYYENNLKSDQISLKHLLDFLSMKIHEFSQNSISILKYNILFVGLVKRIFYLFLYLFYAI